MMSFLVGVHRVERSGARVWRTSRPCYDTVFTEQQSESDVQAVGEYRLRIHSSNFSFRSVEKLVHHRWCARVTADDAAASGLITLYNSLLSSGPVSTYSLLNACVIKRASYPVMKHDRVHGRASPSAAGSFLMTQVIENRPY